MIPLTPRCLIAAAEAFVGLREEGDNRGLMIDLFLKGVNQPPGQPWCAAFVHHVGQRSHFDPIANKSSWPLPNTASCYMLGVYAAQQRILVDEPLDGDVFLLWSPMYTRFAHTGIVSRVVERGKTPAGSPWFDCHTIEGNTNDDGGRDGWGVLRRIRRFYPRVGDRFVRWAELDRPRAINTVASPRRAA
jgi:hypothetical protein